MKLKLDIAGEVQELQVVADKALGGHRVTSDSGEHHLEIVDRRGSRWLLRIDGNPLEAFIAGQQRATWVGTASGIRLLRRDEERRRREGRGEGGLQLVTPRFPATVVKVLVEPGQRVARSEGLVVVAAMKMEMTLGSPWDGVVRAVNAEVGQNVSPGDVLIDVEADQEESGDG